MRSTRRRKVFAWMMSALLVISLLPAVAFGEEGSDSGSQFHFTVSIMGNGSEQAPEELEPTLEKKNGYLSWGNPADLFVITVPFGTSTVELSLPQKYLVYNYTGQDDGSGAIASKNYLSGTDSSSDTAPYKYNVKVDSEGAEAAPDGYFDYIQIQTPYVQLTENEWSSDLLAAVTFQYDKFNVLADGQRCSRIEMEKNGYQPPDEWVQEGESWVPKRAEKTDLYIVTLPERIQAVTLHFSVPMLAYNYNSEGLCVDQNKLEYNEGADTVNVNVSHEGEFDYIQVQEPGSQKVKYAITFTGFDPTETENQQNQEVGVEELLHGIASMYAEKGAAGDQNAPWIAADMMAYEKAFPNSDYKLSDDQKQAMVDEAIAALERDSLSPGDAAKYVLALVAMGFNPKELTTSTGTPLNGKEIMDGVCFEDETVSTSASSVYTLPAVILAYWQLADSGESVEKLVKGESVEKLVKKAVEEKNNWLNTDYGTDTLTMMMLALSPMYGMESQYPGITDALNQAKSILNEKQLSSGSIMYPNWTTKELFGGENPSTDGLAIAGLAAMGVVPSSMKCQEENAQDLLTGLVRQAKSVKGFGSAFYDEQGFRGLIAASQVLPGVPYQIYNFKNQVLVPAEASKGNVSFHVIPASANVSVKKENDEITPVEKNLYNLEEGMYSYTVSCSGYKDKSGTITVTAEDIASFKKQIENVSLVQSSASSSDNTVGIAVRVLSHGSNHDDSVSYTYKNNPEKFASLLEAESYTATLTKNEGTARDALVEALDDSGLSYVEQSNGYFSRIGDFTEFGHGAKSGWLYMVNGKAGTSAMEKVTFSRNGTLTVFFTDDYSNDYGSENWGGGSSSGKDKDKDPADDPADDPGKDPVDNGYYDDTKGHWAEDTINKVTDRGWMKGVADRKFAPDTTLSRGMFVTMLYRIEMPWAGAPDKKEPWPENGFTDVEKGSWYEEAVAWAAACGIVKGTSDTTFSPNADVTREQMAAFLYRYNELKAGSRKPEADPSAISHYTDADQISGYAKEPLSWAVENGLINGVAKNRLQPKGNATRAQAATIVIRFDERAFSNGTAGN